MSNENRQPIETLKRPSVVRQAWQLGRFIRYAQTLPAETFSTEFGTDIQQAFAGDPESKLQSINTGEAVPVLICAFNEMKGNNIGRTLYALAAQQDVRVQPVVVDNGSTDGTGDFAREMGALVVVTPGQNEGILKGLRTGFQYFHRNNYTGPLLHTDADNVPLPFWASTLVNYGETHFPTGGEAFGPCLFYSPDKPLFSQQNVLPTLGVGAHDLGGYLKGNPSPHGGNGIIMTDPEGRILEGLAGLEGTNTIADHYVRDAVRDAGGTIAACLKPSAAIISSSRGFPNLLDNLLRPVPGFRERIKARDQRLRRS